MRKFKAKSWASAYHGWCTNPAQFHIPLVKLLKGKTRIHFQYKRIQVLQREDGILRLKPISNQPKDFSFLPHKKEETSVPNKIYNRLIDLVQSTGGGWAETGCTFDNPNKGKANKPTSPSFIRFWLEYAFGFALCFLHAVL